VEISTPASDDKIANLKYLAISDSAFGSFCVGEERRAEKSGRIWPSAKFKSKLVGSSEHQL